MSFYTKSGRTQIRFRAWAHQMTHCTVAASLAIGCAALLPTVVTETAWAQASAGGRTLEEIIVTARRREESLQDTPVTVNVFTADDLDARNILILPEVARYAPNVVIDAAINSAGPSNNIAVFIRGIGATDYTLSVDPGVATYVDGVYMSRSIGGVLDLLTVESIEILKGPQGTLFGRNTVGGAVNITSQKPHDEFEARVRATAGEDSRLEGTLALNIPLGEAVFSSVSLQYREIDGWVTNLDVGADGLPNTADDTSGGSDWGARERISARVALRWEAGDSVTVDLAADYMDEDADPAPFVLVDVVSGLNEAPLPSLWNLEGSGVLVPPFFTPILLNGQPIPQPCAAPFADPGAPGANPANCYNNQWLAGKFATFSSNDTIMQAIRNDPSAPVGPEENYEVWGVSLNLAWDIGENLTFKSITGYREQDSNFNRDGDHTPLPIQDSLTPYEHEQLSQELQLLGNSFNDRLTWILGGYYIEEEGFHVDNIGFPGIQIRAGGSVDTDNWAVFGQGSYAFTDKLTLTLGARYTDEEKVFTPENVVLLDDGLAFNTGVITFLMGISMIPPAQLPPPYSLTGTRLFTNPTTIESDETTPYVNLAYDITDTVNVFATYSEGFKTGGVTQRIADPILGLPTPANPMPELPGFEPEFVTAYELGLKSTWLNNTLRLNGAVFFNEYEDLQVQALRPDSIVVFTINAAESEVLGAEAELEWLATDALSIHSTLGWMDAEYTKLDPDAQNFGITLDSELVNTPEWSGSLSAAYEIPVGTWFLTPRLDYSYTSEMFKDTRNTVLIKVDDLHLLNANLRLANPDQSWVLTFRVDNLTDENYLLSGANFAEFGELDAMYDRGRLWSFTLNYNFN